MFRSAAFAAVTLATLFSPIAAGAQSLAGQEGDKRYPVQFGNVRGNCPQIYKAYVAARGHSAYAQTPKVRGVAGFFCGYSVNARSQAEAERRALISCRDTGKRYKYRTISNCQIYASK